MKTPVTLLIATLLVSTAGYARFTLADSLKRSVFTESPGKTSAHQPHGPGKFITLSILTVRAKTGDDTVLRISLPIGINPVNTTVRQGDRYLQAGKDYTYNQKTNKLEFPDATVLSQQGKKLNITYQLIAR
nr:hypothetical protein [uncultured Arsenicibacter sp.]